MYPRRLIMPSRSVAHVFFRCHNRQALLTNPKIKFYLVRLWAKYKKKYGIRIFDFIILDNHVHMLLRAEDSDRLGDFMRTCNSQLSRYINKILDRDSQAIRERYKSPVCSRSFYTVQVMQYIWLNRYKIDKKDPRKDIFCSVSWRLNPSLTRLFHEESKDLNDLIDHLLDPYEAASVSIEGSVRTFIKDLLNQALSIYGSLCGTVLTHSTTIGDEVAIAFRREFLNAYRRESHVIP